MTKEIDNNFISRHMFLSTSIGCVQTIIGYPLDTLKTNLQSTISRDNSILRENKISIKKTMSLFKGVKYPLVLNIACQNIFFSSYHYIDYKLQNPFISGLLSGSIIGLISNPFEYYKVCAQNNIINNNKYSRQNILKSFTCGLKQTLLRESISSGIYFYTYFKMTENNYHPFISGGISGVNSWLITFPIDTYKTRIQSGKKINETMISFLKNKNTWSGLGYCLSRAFLVNSVSFYLYDKILNDKY
jgi:solute carrier family 25 carnitine/acylcarnitine transporter 20/29